jgi:hypothetical protein
MITKPKQILTIEGLAHTLRRRGVTVWTPKTHRRHALYVAIPSDPQVFASFTLASRWRWIVALRDQHGGLIYGVYPHSTIDSRLLPIVFDAMAVAARVTGIGADAVSRLREIAALIRKDPTP